MTHRTLHRPVHLGACADPPTASPWATLPEVLHIGSFGRPIAQPDVYHVEKMKTKEKKKKQKMNMVRPWIVGYTLVELEEEDAPR